MPERIGELLHVLGKKLILEVGTLEDLNAWNQDVRI